MKIVYGATRNYYSLLLPSIMSLLDHNQPDVVYVLAEDDEVPNLPDICRVINVSGQQWIKPESPNWHTPYSFMVLVRAAFAYIFPDDERVLSLDVDTIICDSLEPVWNVDLDGKYIAAVNEWQGAFKPFGARYYNCGVCLFNLDQIRADGVADDWIRELNTMQYIYPEQDVINMYSLPDKVEDLPVRYNESFCCGITDDPAVVHFAGIPDWMSNKKMFRREFFERYAPLVDSLS